MIEEYHAHVYYTLPERQAAETLCTAAEERYSLRRGRMHDAPVGPHPMGSCQLAFRADQLADIVPWLMENRGDLTVFMHGETGDDWRDHTQHVVWFGKSWPLDLSIFNPPE